MPVRRRPWDLFQRARRSVAEARADDAFLYAAALAFFGLVSVAPLVVVALWVTSVLVGDAHVQEVGDDLARLAPPDLGVEVALERVADLGTTVGLIAVAAALWPASAYGTALVRVFDRLDGERNSSALRGRGATLLLLGAGAGAGAGQPGGRVRRCRRARRHRRRDHDRARVGARVELHRDRGNCWRHLQAPAAAPALLARRDPRFRRSCRRHCHALGGLRRLSAAGCELWAAVRIGCAGRRGASRGVAVRLEHRAAARIRGGTSRRSRAASADLGHAGEADHRSSSARPGTRTLWFH